MDLKRLVEVRNKVADGVRYDNESRDFVFDFSQDGKSDIIKLCNTIYESKFYGRTLFFGYEFEPFVDKNVRKDFIKELKFGNKIKQSDKDRFIMKVGTDLDQAINLASYDVFVVPESSSNLNFEIEQHLSRLARPKYIKYELIKSMPKDISFDYESFEHNVLSKTINGKPRYSETNKRKVLDVIDDLMDKIHNLDYFSIAKEVKMKYRPYIMNYYQFKTKDEETAFKRLNESNILVFDDIMTSGTTMQLILKTIHNLKNFKSSSNKVTVFSLLGRNFLKKDSNDA